MDNDSITCNNNECDSGKQILHLDHDPMIANAPRLDGTREHPPIVPKRERCRAPSLAEALVSVDGRVDNQPSDGIHRYDFHR